MNGNLISRLNCIYTLQAIELTCPHDVNVLGQLGPEGDEVLGAGHRGDGPGAAVLCGAEQEAHGAPAQVLLDLVGHGDLRKIGNSL